MSPGGDDTEFGHFAFEDRSFPDDYRSAQILSIAEQLTSRDNQQLATAYAYALPGTPKLPGVDSKELAGVVRNVREKRSRGSQKESSAYLHDRAGHGDVDAAVELVDNFLDDSSPTVRVAASSAAIALEVASGARVDDLPYRLVRPLVDAVRDGQPEAEVAEIMLEALEEVGRPEPEFAQGVDESVFVGIRRQEPHQDLSIGVHGTFSRRRSSPMFPPHAFYKGLRREVTPSLYPHSRSHFRWTSRYRSSDRQQAAEDLQRWTHLAGDRDELDTVYAHSHGGNVVLEALSQKLVRVKFLVLLSVPAVRRSDNEWDSINEQVGWAVSYRAGFDPVIAVDRLAHNIGFRRESTEPSDGPEFPSRFHVHQQPPVNSHAFGFTHSGWLNPILWARARMFQDLRYEAAMAREQTK
jgi:pimeloyl-ACP methyl ester carboxylesterase